jgi:hypothetical protein
MRSWQGDKGCDPCQQAIKTNRPLQRDTDPVDTKESRATMLLDKLAYQ